MNGLSVIQGNAQGLINIEDYAMGINGLIKQAELIQQAMESVMKDGEHYGKIPGTNKPTLLKPGAEKLCLIFRFKQDYSIIREDRTDGFIAYTIECRLTHYPTGTLISTGIGSCNSRETKYAYRYVYEPTGKALPSEYWKAKSSGNNKEMKRLLGSEGRPYKMDDGKWVIAVSQKVKNDNPWDLDNTLIKMACKRALVAATLNGTAASDIFTQDLEELLETEGRYPRETEGDTDDEQGNDAQTITLDDFLAQIPEGLDRKQFKTFLEQSAAFAKKPIEEMIGIASKNFAETVRSFERWTKKQAEGKDTQEPKKSRGRPAKAPETPPQDVATPPAEAGEPGPGTNAEPTIDDQLKFAKKNFTRSFKKACLMLGLVAHMDGADALDISNMSDEQKHALNTKINAEVDKEQV